MTRAACTCPPGDQLPSTSCKRHGLDGGEKYAPMDRHARRADGPHGRQVETAGQVQRRLYLEAASDRVRVEAAGYPWPLRALPPRLTGPSQR